MADEPVAKRTSPQQLRNVITSYFCSPRLFVFPENYELLKKHDFELPIDDLCHMKFLEYFQPTVQQVEKAFERTTFIEVRGEYLFFNQAKQFEFDGFDLQKYSLVYGPFPKSFTALQMEKIVERGAGKAAVYSVSVEKQYNCYLLVIFANNSIKNQAVEKKQLSERGVMNSKEYEEASKRMRSILKSEKGISSKDAVVAFQALFAFDSDQEFIAEALRRIQKSEKAEKEAAGEKPARPKKQ